MESDLKLNEQEVAQDLFDEIIRAIKKVQSRNGVEVNELLLTLDMNKLSNTKLEVAFKSDQKQPECILVS